MMSKGGRVGTPEGKVRVLVQNEETEGDWSE